MIHGPDEKVFLVICALFALVLQYSFPFAIISVTESFQWICLNSVGLVSPQFTRTDYKPICKQ